MVQTILQTIEFPLSPFVFGGRCPRYAGRAVSLVPLWRRHSCSHSCSSLRNCRPQLQFIKVVHIPVVVQRPISMVLVTIESPQLQFDKVSSSLLCWLCSSTGAGCGGDIPQLHRVRHPRVVMQRQFPLAQLFCRPLRFSSCSSLIWCSTSLLFGSTVRSFLGLMSLTSLSWCRGMFPWS